MTGKRRVALVGDYNPAVIAHQAIPEALRLAGLQNGDDVEGVWLHTASIGDPAAQLRDFAGIWCVPALTPMPTAPWRRSDTPGSGSVPSSEPAPASSTRCLNMPATYAACTKPPTPRTIPKLPAA